MWRAMTETGQLAYPDFVESTRAVIPMYVLRALGGTMFLSGAILGGVNFYKTWKSRPAKYEEPVYSAPPLDPVYAGDADRPADRYDHTVARGANNLAVWSTLWWHRKWERLPIKFTILTTLAVVTASLFEIIPTFLIRSNVPTIASVHPYTPLELTGRDIYLAEGCYNCHSQMIRPIVAETKRFGEYSKPGEFVYDHPFQWGSRRIGPDLAREGGKQSDLWHVLHFANPPQVTPGTIMPRYPWLLTEKTDLASIPVRVRAMQALGVPYTDAQREQSVDLAKAQAKEIADRVVQQGGPKGLEDKEVVALIAYLQRLGTDLFKAPPTEAPSPTPVPDAPANANAAQLSSAAGGN
jgi:cytochrome c oxidase cbb3-type subunit I/II